MNPRMPSTYSLVDYTDYTIPAPMHRWRLAELHVRWRAAVSLKHLKLEMKVGQLQQNKVLRTTLKRQ
jgi:hypothetical protein